MSDQIKALFDLVDEHLAEADCLTVPGMAVALVDAEMELKTLIAELEDKPELQRRILSLDRTVAQLTWERDRYRKVVDAVSVLDSIKVQRMALELKRG